MALRLYMDVHVPRAIATGLRARGIDAPTAQEDGAEEFLDEDLLRRATSLNRVVFTFESDFKRIAAECQRDGVEFAGVNYAQALFGIGVCVEGLYVMAAMLDEADLRGTLEYLIR